MRTARDFVRLVRRIRLILAAADGDWGRDPEMRDILHRMADHFARLLAGEPEPRSLGQARRALRARRLWRDPRHGRNGNGSK